MLEHASSDSVNPSESLLPIAPASSLPLATEAEAPVRRRLPPWLKRPLPQADMYFTAGLIEELHLDTVPQPGSAAARSIRSAMFAHASQRRRMRRCSRRSIRLSILVLMARYWFPT